MSTLRHRNACLEGCHSVRVTALNSASAPRLIWPSVCSRRRPLQCVAQAPSVRQELARGGLSARALPPQDAHCRTWSVALRSLMQASFLSTAVFIGVFGGQPAHAAKSKTSVKEAVVVPVAAKEPVKAEANVAKDNVFTSTSIQAWVANLKPEDLQQPQVFVPAAAVVLAFILWMANAGKGTSAAVLQGQPAKADALRGPSEEPTATLVPTAETCDTPQVAKPVPAVPAPAAVKPVPALPVPAAAKPVPAVPAPAAVKPEPAAPAPAAVKPEPAVPAPAAVKPEVAVVAPVPAVPQFSAAAVAGVATPATASVAQIRGVLVLEFRETRVASAAAAAKSTASVALTEPAREVVPAKPATSTPATMPEAPTASAAPAVVSKVQEPDAKASPSGISARTASVPQSTAATSINSPTPTTTSSTAKPAVPATPAASTSAANSTAKPAVPAIPTPSASPAAAPKASTAAVAPARLASEVAVGSSGTASPGHSVPVAAPEMHHDGSFIFSSEMLVKVPPGQASKAPAAQSSPAAPSTSKVAPSLGSKSATPAPSKASTPGATGQAKSTSGAVEFVHDAKSSGLKTAQKREDVAKMIIGAMVATTEADGVKDFTRFVANDLTPALGQLLRAAVQPPRKQQ